MKKLAFFPAVFYTAICLSQPPRGPLIESPVINADHSVTFRYRDPNADSVVLSGQFLKAPRHMTKDTGGVWSIKVEDIKPDIYPYSFQVDGVTVMDPGNVAFFPNERFKASLVNIPGDTPLVHSLQDVPHGSVTYEYYPSIDGSTGSLVIYTPPGYDKERAKKYPVFYLISGTTDTEETFFKVGQTNLILDNLIAQGKAKPMIIVMPYGNPMARIAEQTGKPKPSDIVSRDGDDAIKRAKLFETDLVTKVIPYVEKNYRTISNRDNRAIGGFSRGGGQTLRAGFGNMDKFSWICCYSAYISTPEMESSFKNVYENPDRTNKQLKLLWVSVGNEDFLYNPTVEFMDFLKSKKVNYKSLVTPGGHTWMNVKTYVAATAQLLFQ